MIILDIDKWCNNCNEFEPEVTKNNEEVNCDYTRFNPIISYRFNTIIECKHKHRCKCMIEYLENKG